MTLKDIAASVADAMKGDEPVIVKVCIANTNKYAAVAGMIIDPANRIVTLQTGWIPE